MTKATPDEQRRLLDLQASDTAIRQLQHRRANLPEQKALDDHRALLDKVSAEHRSARDELQTVTRRQIRLEGDLAAVDARRKSDEGRMYSGVITSERELEALRSELATLKARKNELEDDLLQVMERHEELASLIQTLERRESELADGVAPLETTRDTAAADIDSDLGAQEATRARLAAEVPDGVLRQYEDLLKRKDGLAVAELQGRTCMGCHLELTISELEEAREQARQSLARCVQCGRILVRTG